MTTFGWVALVVAFSAVAGSLVARWCIGWGERWIEGADDRQEDDRGREG